MSQAAPRAADVRRVRSFNRFYTRHIGALDEGLLDSRYSLTEARVIFELGSADGISAREIGERLGLDKGYLSRLVRAFIAQRLVSRKKSERDARVVELRLTAKGRAVFEQLDSRSQAQAAAQLAVLPPGRRRDLLAALGTAQALLGGGSDATVTLRAPQPGDFGWAIERHASLYAQEYGWNGEFEWMVADLFLKFARTHDVSCERCWIAELGGVRGGCVFVVRNAENPQLAQLRCLIVDPAARGHGVGERLVKECITYARASGYRGMTLWTNDILIAARKIYQAHGFRLVDESCHHSFGKDLVGQTWVLEF
ncbi:MAG: bifunctional helix-turn-helix transcriptional regulator/GNAT family N-acetyltransferase [Solimonas sp.]